MHSLPALLASLAASWKSLFLSIDWNCSKVFVLTKLPVDGEEKDGLHLQKNEELLVNAFEQTISLPCDTMF
jgi:hypothetical protein